MTPDQILLAAARHLHDLAGRADTGGAWKAVPDILIGGWAVAPHDAEGPYIATFVRPEHAYWTSLVHPGIGLMLAAVFEQAAEALIGADVAEDEPILVLARAVLTGQPA